MSTTFHNIYQFPDLSSEDPKALREALRQTHLKLNRLMLDLQRVSGEGSNTTIILGGSSGGGGGGGGGSTVNYRAREQAVTANIVNSIAFSSPITSAFVMLIWCYTGSKREEQVGVEIQNVGPSGFEAIPLAHATLGYLAFAEA